MKHLIQLLFILTAIKSWSQKPIRRDDCGTPAGLTPYIVSPLAPHAPMITTPFLMKIFVHVFADDDGSNLAATKEQVMEKLFHMRNFYDDHSICFILGGYEEIDNSDLNNQNSSTEAAELNSFLVANHVNIFVHAALSDNNGTLNGTSYAIPNWYFSIVGSAVSSTTNLTVMPHEIGHDFGLYHTFEQWWNSMGVPTLSENVPRSGDCTNCTTTGDLLCDTHADRDEGVDASCNYTGTMRDACNNLFTPNTRNIMGYGNRSCRNFLTLGQGDRARSVINGNTNLSGSVAPDNAVITNANYSSGRQSLLARNSITINVSSYIVQGTARMNISAPVVRLQPGVRLTPTGDGYTKIVPNTLCQ